MRVEVADFEEGAPPASELAALVTAAYADASEAVVVAARVVLRDESGASIVVARPYDAHGRELRAGRRAFRFGGDCDRYASEGPGVRPSSTLSLSLV